MNLKYMLLCGRVILGRAPIVTEFDPQWPPKWRESVWANESCCIRVEHVMERDDLCEVYDIDPTPAHRYNSESTYIITQDVTPIRFVEWTNDTYLHVLSSGCRATEFNINFTMAE